MACHTLILTKVIGTVSLGAFAGSVLSTTHTALPLILLSKTPNDLQLALTTLRDKSLQLLSPLAITSFSTFAISYFFASSAARHPYLIYSALSVPIVAAISYFKINPVYNSLLAETNVSKDTLDIASTNSEQSTPVTQDGSPALSATSTDEDVEPSNLDNSVFRNISKSDYEEDIPKQSAKTLASVSNTQKQSAQTVSPATVGILVKQLTRLGNITSSVSGLAFVIATIGIFGDIAKR